jgi:hypothetical protein
MNRLANSRPKSAHRKSQNPINCADPIEHDSSPELCKQRNPPANLGPAQHTKKLRQWMSPQLLRVHLPHFTFLSLLLANREPFARQG